MFTFLPFCRRLSVGLSVYSVALFSIQRYRVTVNPFHVLFSSPPLWIVIVATIRAVWNVAALFAVPSSLSQHLCKEFLTLRQITNYKRVVIFELLVFCVFPLIVIALTYIMIVRHLVESSDSISEGTKNPLLETCRNTAKTVVVSRGNYVTYHALRAYKICTEEVEIYCTKITIIIIYLNYKFLYLMSTCFLLINSCLNPVALFCTSSPFKQHLKCYLTCFC
jgi:hypothetical protein